MRLVPINKLRSGNNPITISYEGDDIMNVAYVGDTLSFVRFAEYPKLKLDTEELMFRRVGGSQNITVNTNANWSASTSASWLTVTTASTGFTVDVPFNDTHDVREGVINVTAWNVNAVITSSVTVTQTDVSIEYIHSSNMVNNSGDYIPLGIYPSHVTRGRLIGQMKGYTTGNVLVGNSATDSRDWRVFFTSRTNWYMDVGSARVNGNIGVISVGNEFDISFGNLYVENNMAGTKISGATTTSTMDQREINVCVGVVWVKSLQLWEGDNLVFDGAAAQNGDKYGLLDSVSGQFFGNSNINIVGEMGE